MSILYAIFGILKINQTVISRPCSAYEISEYEYLQNISSPSKIASINNDSFTRKALESTNGHRLLTTTVKQAVSSVLEDKADRSRSLTGAQPYISETTLIEVISGRANYFDFAKSFALFVSYFFVCILLPVGIVFVPANLFWEFINRPTYVTL